MISPYYKRKYCDHNELQSRLANSQLDGNSVELRTFRSPGLERAGLPAVRREGTGESEPKSYDLKNYYIEHQKQISRHPSV